MEERGYRPVDQLAEDVDPLQKSLRLHEDGLQTTGERSNVFRPRLPQDAGGRAADQPRLLYVAEGVVAEFDRSIYAIDLRRRRILQVIPPNTVFHVGVPEVDGHDADKPTPEQQRRRAMFRIHPMPAGQRLTSRPDARPTTTRPADQPDYASLADAHRLRVVAAVRRLISP
jgi:hypothetical protein